MDLLRNAANAANKGYKFLQELDEPRPIVDAEEGEAEPAPSLEASLEGAAGRLLSWAGSAAQQLPGLGSESDAVSRASSFSQAAASEPRLAAEPPKEADSDRLASDGGSTGGAQPSSPSPKARSAEPQSEGGSDTPAAAGAPMAAAAPVQEKASALQFHYIGDDEDDDDAAQEGGDEVSSAAALSPTRGEGADSSMVGSDGDDRPRVDSSGWWSGAAAVDAEGGARQEKAGPSAQGRNTRDDELHTAELARLRQELMAQAQENEQSAREVSRTRQEAAKLRADLEDARDMLQQREKQLGQLSEILAEKEALCQESAQRALKAERRSKQDAQDTEKELLQAQDRWREKIAAAERRAQEAQQEAQGKVAAVVAERDEARAEVEKLHGEVASKARSEGKAQKEFESNRSSLEAECQRLAERLRTSADVEIQLRRELASMEQGRADLEERCADLTGQLERTQSAYDVAAAEVGAMSSRLHELEFGSKADTSVEDLLRQQLDAAKERCNELEQRVNECSWMRDYALQQAEEARAQLNAQRADLARSGGASGTGACAEAAPGGADEAAVPSEEARKAREEADELKAQLQRLAEQHREELKHQAQMTQDEVDYLKRKNDEKDRRLEVLTCERNTLRFESAEQQRVAAAGESSSGGNAACGASSEALPDLEDARLDRKSRLAEQGTATGAVSVALTEGDVVLRRLSRLLYLSPLMRRIFYGYIAFLHVWIWVVLHRAAAAHSPHGA